MSYLILMIHPKTSRPVPMLEDDTNDIALFEEYEEAETVAEEHETSSAWGFQIVEWDFDPPKGGKE